MSPSSDVRAFWPAFQKRWAALLCEQTQGVNTWSEAMARALARGIIEVPSSAEAHAALDGLNIRLTRIESAQDVSLGASPDGASRSHFVRYGIALLNSHALPQVAETNLDYSALRLALNGLCEWLQLLKLKPRRIYALEDFDSQIIACALARQLGIEYEVADSDGLTHSKSLVVSADSRHLSASSLRTVFPGQVLYAFNLHPETGAIAPDVCSSVGSDLSLPWRHERLTLREISVVAERITDAPPGQPTSDWPNRLEFYRARRSLLTVGNSTYSRSFTLPESGSS